MNRPEPNSDPDPQLEAFLDAELKRLPLVPAPAAVAAGVMAQLRAREGRPWWQGVWWEWPWQAKVASILIALVLAGAFGGGNALFEDRVATYSDEVTARFGFAATGWAILESLGKAMVLVWDVLGQPWLLVAGGLVVVLSLTGVCFGLGMAFVRVAGKET